MEIWTGMLLLSVCGASAALGGYLLQEQADPRVRNWFLAACAALDLWAFGLAVRTGAQAEIVGALGDLLAKIGWSLTICSLLSLLCELADSHSLLEKRLFRAAAYLPSAVAVAVSLLLPFQVGWGKLMAPTDWGWGNAAAARSLWRFLPVLQLFVFAALCLGVLLRWVRLSKTAEAARQARFLLLVGVLPGLLAMGTEPLADSAGRSIPPVEPLLLLASLLAAALVVHPYRFFHSDRETVGPILRDYARARIYDYIGLFTAGCAALAWFYSPAEGAAGAFWLGVFLMAVALCLIGVNFIRLDNSVRELVFSLCIAVLIPVVTLWSVQAEHLTVWAFIFIVAVLALSFNRLILLITFAVSSLATQLFVWVYHPVDFVHLTPFAYSLRLLILLLLAGFSLYVQRIYVQRLRENVLHTRKETLVAQISQAFIAVDEYTLDQTLQETLECCGAFLRCDRACLDLLDREGRTLQRSLEWQAEGVSPRACAPELCDFSALLSLPLEKDGVIQIPDTARLPAVFRDLKRNLQKQGIRGLVVIPIRNDGVSIGFLGFTAATPTRRWNLTDASFLQVIAAILSDTFLKLEAEREISFTAYHDHLTQLPNRLLFYERLTQAIPLAERQESMIAVVFLDLDSFKSVNDTMGHDMGDRLLREVAQALSRTVRKYDTVSRFGGDEFIVLLNQISQAEDISRIMQKLMEPFRHTFSINGQELFVSVSAGIALYPQDGRDADTLIKNADAAMYHAKDTGKNGYAFCSQAIKNEILEKMRLSNLLYRAIEKDQLVLYYQPQVDTAEGTIVGCEALLRWDLPGNGRIPPSVLIPLAEQTGLIHSIGKWVLETACRQNVEWHTLGFPELRIAVNLSVHQLKNPTFVQQVSQILAETGLPPHCLELEITESAANENVDNILEILGSLKALGISIAIDDFGTEYSSLNRLKLLPIDRIKIDMQFVQGIEKDEKDEAISKIIIGLAKSLDLKVIAEGVETSPQLNFLTQRLCDEVQGYYYYRPMPAQEVTQILKERREQAAP